MNKKWRKGRKYHNFTSTEVAVSSYEGGKELKKDSKCHKLVKQKL